MATLQEQYDDAMYDFSMADYDSAILRLQALLAGDPNYFDARLSLGMAYFRKGDYAAAIAEGRKAEKLKPNDQLVHTNLSLFFMKSGDKPTAEHHGMRARIVSWKENMAPPGSQPKPDPELKMAGPRAVPAAENQKYPEMPWKKKPPAADPL